MPVSTRWTQAWALVAALALVVAASMASAQDDFDELDDEEAPAEAAASWPGGRSWAGWYVGGGISASIPDSTFIDESGGLELLGSLRGEINGLEVQLEWIGPYDVAGMNISSAVNATYNYRIAPLATVLDSPVQPFLVAGVGIQWIELDDRRFGNEIEFIYRIGGGIEYMMPEEWFGIEEGKLVSYLRTTYVASPETSREDQDSINVAFGLLWHF